LGEPGNDRVVEPRAQVILLRDGVELLARVAEAVRMASMAMVWAKGLFAHLGQILGSPTTYLILFFLHTIHFSFFEKFNRG